MENIGNIILGIMIPFAGTTLGAACVYFMKKGIRQNVEKGLLGFASGVMVAASVWSLLIPSMNLSADLGRLAFLPAVTGFFCGILFNSLTQAVLRNVRRDDVWRVWHEQEQDGTSLL